MNCNRSSVPGIATAILGLVVSGSSVRFQSRLAVVVFTHFTSEIVLRAIWCSGFRFRSTQVASFISSRVIVSGVALVSPSIARMFISTDST